MMPVEGDNNARSATSAGSSARASSPLSQMRSDDAVGLGLGFKRGELVDLFRVHRHQELAASLVRNAELLAERVEHRLAVDAEPRLVEPCPIIDAGMDHFAVARTNPRANPALAFDDDDFPPRPGERSRDREADDARADDQTLDQFHPSTPYCSWSITRRRSFSRSQRIFAENQGETPRSSRLQSSIQIHLV